MAHFEATADFVAAVSEIDYLLRSAEASADDVAVYNVLNKATILLLAAKLEAFIERIIEDYCFSLSEKQLPSERVPVKIKLSATRQVLNDEFLGALDRMREDKAIPPLEALARLWYQGATPTAIAVDCKFAYGRHGEREVCKLFQRVGIDNIFDTCKITEETESYATDEQQQQSSVASDVNALVGYRNYIMHNDGTPSVTHGQLGDYRRRLLLFAESVDQFMARSHQAIS